MKIWLGIVMGLAAVSAFADATFMPLNPVPVGATVEPESVAPGDSATFSYSAALATSCAVTQSGCSSPLNLPSAGCTGVGPQSNCSASVQVTVPPSLTNCVASLTVSCNPGGVKSVAELNVTASTISLCSDLRLLPTAIPGKNWTMVLQSRVLWGDGTTSSTKDATDYMKMWSYPGTTPAWPGAYGLTTRPSGAAPNQYFAEKFTVPIGGNTRANWAFAGSGLNSNFSTTISTCPGDFGQLGSQIPPYCRTDLSGSSGGIRAIVSPTQVGSFCSLKPGGEYYINFLPMAHLPKNPFDLSKSTCTGSPCSPWAGLN